jgi:hypothetical protein
MTTEESVGNAGTTKLMKFKLWKGNNKGTGSAFIADLNLVSSEKGKGVDVWGELLAQNKEGSGPKYDTNGIKIKLGLSDLQEILTVLKGIKEAAGVSFKTKDGESVGIYHKTPNSNNSSLIRFFYQEEWKNFRLTVQQTKEGQTRSNAISFSFGEALQFALFIEEALKQIMWADAAT